VPRVERQTTSNREMLDGLVLSEVRVAEEADGVQLMLLGAAGLRLD